MKIDNKTLMLTVILLVGLAVRVIGLDFGLPFAYHTDEPMIVNYALAYGAGDLNPHFFKISPFLSYILFFLYGVYYLIGRLFGLFGGVNEFGYLFLNDPTSFYLIGRVTAGLVFGTASIYLIYELGRRVFSRNTGLIAALFLALNFMHVRNSHYIYLDVPLVFFMLLYFICLKSLSGKNRGKDYMLSGMFLGLAVSMKYSGIFMIVPTVPVIFRNMIRSRDDLTGFLKKCLLFGCFFVLALFVTNPFMFLDYRFFVEHMSRMALFPMDFWYHLKVSLLGSCGLFMCLAAVIGMALAVKRGDFFGILLVLFAGVYYLVLTRSSQHAERYVFPILPVILLFAADFTAAVIKSAGTKIAKTAFGIILCSVLLVPSVVKVYYSDRLLAGADTRTESYDWIKENIPAGTGIALDATGPLAPVIEQKKELIVESLKRFDSPKFDSPGGALDYKVKLFLENPGYTDQTYEIQYLRNPSRNDRFLMTYPEAPLDLDELKERGVKYVVANSLLVNDSGKVLLERLESESELAAEFSPYKEGAERLHPMEVSNITAAPFSFRELRDRKKMGPVIRVYRIR